MLVLLKQNSVKMLFFSGLVFLFPIKMTFLSPSIQSSLNLYRLISLILFRWIVIYLVHGTIQHRANVIG